MKTTNGTPKNLTQAIKNALPDASDADRKEVEAHVRDFLNQCLGCVMLGTDEEAAAASKLHALMFNRK